MVANLNLVQQRVTNVRLANNINSSMQLELGSSYNLNVTYRKDGNQCIANLTQAVVDKETEGKVFSFVATIEGIFSCEGATTDEIKRQIHVAVYDYLFPYVQTYCSTLFNMTGFNGFVLQKTSFDPSQISVGKPTEGQPRNPDGGPNLSILS